MADLDSKTKLPLGWVVGIAAFVFSAGGGFALAQVQISASKEDVAELKASTQTQSEINHQMDKRMALTEEGQHRIEETLKRIEEKLDRGREH